MKYKFHLRFGELLSVIGMIRDGFVRDMSDFASYKSHYNQAFVDTLDLRIEGLKRVVENKIKLAELKLMTKNLYELMKSLMPMIKRIEGFVEDANGLSVGKKSFGFKAVREKLRRNNINGVVMECRTIWKLLDDNMGVLEPEGYSDVRHAEFKALIDEIEELFLARNMKEDEKEAMVQANMVFLNGLYTDIMKIASDGKHIYLFTNEEKTGDYTVAVIRRRISRE